MDALTVLIRHCNSLLDEGYGLATNRTQNYWLFSGVKPHVKQSPIRSNLVATQDLTLLAVAETDAHSAGSAHHLTIWIHGFHLTHSIRDLDRLNALIAQAHHLSETTVGNEFHGRNSKARSQDAIERRWRPATLNVP